MNQKKSPWLCYVAGRSGGHIIPALTHAKNHPSHSILFISTDTPLDRSIIEQADHVAVHKRLRLGTTPGKKFLRWPLFLIQAGWAALKTATYLLRYRPQKIVSTGGYCSIVVCYVGWLLRIPFEVFELNVIPGRAARVLSYGAQTMHVCFATTARYLSKRARIKQSSYPLRFSDDDRMTTTQARVLLGIDPEMPVLCVVGGSQGSQSINEQVMRYVCATSRVPFVIHQTGADSIDRVQNWYQQHKIPSLVFSYRSDLQVCYAAADLVVARAGAGTLFELLFFEKRSLIIPLESVAGGHQVYNAQAMAAEHPEYFTVLRQAELDAQPELFAQMIASHFLSVEVKEKALVARPE